MAEALVQSGSGSTKKRPSVNDLEPALELSDTLSAQVTRK